MTPTLQVTVINVDKKGNYWKEALPINDALLKLLRFARQKPHAICTIELREGGPAEQSGLSEVSMEMQNRDQTMQRHLRRLKAEQENSSADAAQDSVTRLKRSPMLAQPEMPQVAATHFPENSPRVANSTARVP